MSTLSVITSFGRSRSGLSLLVGATVAMLLAPAAPAATLYWDLNGATANTTVAVTGGWNGTNAFWNSSATGTGGTATATVTSADDVVFSSGTTYTTGTVTASISQAVSSVTFENNIITILAGPLGIGGGGTKSGIFVVATNASNSTVSGLLTLAAASNFSNAGNGVLSMSNTISGTQNFTLTNTGGAANGVTISGAVNTTGTITNAGTGAGALISGNIASTVTSVAQTSTTSTLALGGVNSYTGGTTVVDGGSLVFRTLGSKPAAGTTTLGANCTLGLGLSGPNPFTQTDFENLVAGTFADNLANISIGANYRVGIDTSGGEYTYSGALPGTQTVVKFGANALTLNADNSASTAPMVVSPGGSVRVSNGNNFTGGTFSLSGAVTGTATLDLRNDAGTTFSKDILLTGTPATAVHAINVDQAIGGTGTNGVHTIASISQSSALNRTVNVTGGNGYGLTIGNVNLCPGNGQNTTLGANVNTTVLDVTNPMSGYGAANFDTLTLAGAATGNVVTGVIEDANTGTPNATNGGLTRLTKAGAGTWTVSAANTFAGITTIQQGTLSVASINSVTAGSSSSNLGAPTTVANGTIALGNAGNTGSLNYTGPGEVTDRVINLAGTTGGGGITQSGNGLLKFTSANTAGGAGIKVLTLSGSTAGTGEISGAIVNNSAANTTGVTKTGTGTWTLSGVNTYTGPTTVNGGTLLLDKTGTGTLTATTSLALSDGNFSIKGAASGATTQTVASLAVNSGSSRITVNPNGGTSTTLTITSATITRASGGSLTFDTSAGTPATAMIAWNPTLTNGLIGPGFTIKDDTGFGFATVTAGQVTRLSIGGVLDAVNPTDAAKDFITNTTTTITNTVAAAALNSLVIDTTASANTWDLVAGNTATISTGAIAMQGANDFTIQNGTLMSNTATNSDLSVNVAGPGTTKISSVIANGIGIATVTKTGAGTLVLDGPNTYTGVTTAWAGTLVLSSPSSSTSGVRIEGGTGTTVLLTNPAGAGTGSFSTNTGATAANLLLHINGGGTTNIPLVLAGNSGITTTIDVDNNGDGSMNGVMFLNGSGGAAGNSTYNVTGNNGYSLMVANLRLAGGAAGTLLFNPTTSRVSLGNVTVGPAVTTTTGTYVLGLGGTNTGNEVTGVISNNASGPALNSVTKTGSSTWTLSGANTYTGATTVSAGTLKVGSATTFTNKGGLTVNGTGTFDLNGFDSNFTTAASTAGGVITNSGSLVTLTATANVGNAFNGLVTGPLAIAVSNNNAAATLFRLDSPNTFTGGVTLLNSAAGTRLRISAPITTVGAPGAIVSSPYGTGAITIGQAAADKAGLLFDIYANTTLVNDLVFNTALGTDNPGIRFDTIGHVLSGTITANTGASATFCSGAVNTGAVSLTGKITGAAGLALTSSATATTSKMTVTLANASANNDYAGNTDINKISSTNYTLALGAANQIPNGSGKGNVLANGTFRLNGFSETINALNGAGTVDGGSGSPILTLGDGDATGSFSGVINNTSGSLALTKIGIGTQTLSGANTYSGETKVLGGILAVSTGTLPSTGKLTINGGKVEPTGTVVVDTLFFAGTQQVLGTYGSTASTATFKDDTRFSGTGVISVTTSPPTGYASFVSVITNPADRDPNDDPDGDGIVNAIEFVIGGNPAVGDHSALLPTSALTTTDLGAGSTEYLKFTFRRTADSAYLNPGAEYDTDLQGTWTPAAGAAGVVIQTTANGFATGVDRVDVFLPNSLAGGNRLFLRLAVTVPTP